MGIQLLKISPQSTQFIVIKYLGEKENVLENNVTVNQGLRLGWLTTKRGRKSCDTLHLNNYFQFFEWKILLSDIFYRRKNVTQQILFLK